MFLSIVPPVSSHATSMTHGGKAHTQGSVRLGEGKGKKSPFLCSGCMVSIGGVPGSAEGGVGAGGCGLA